MRYLNKKLYLRFKNRIWLFDTWLICVLLLCVLLICVSKHAWVFYTNSQNIIHNPQKPRNSKSRNAKNVSQNTNQAIETQIQFLFYIRICVLKHKCNILVSTVSPVMKRICVLKCRSGFCKYKCETHLCFVILIQVSKTVSVFCTISRFVFLNTNTLH